MLLETQCLTKNKAFLFLKISTYKDEPKKETKSLQSQPSSTQLESNLIKPIATHQPYMLINKIKLFLAHGMFQ
jgi:hypothetical protein